MRFETKVAILFAVLSFSLISVAVWLRMQNAQQELRKSDSQVQGTADYSLYPSITNIAPNIAVVDQLYRYDMVIVDADSAPINIRVKMLEGPAWLNIDKFTLSGVPSFPQSEASKVVLEVSDGEHVIYSTFYIVIMLPDENE